MYDSFVSALSKGKGKTRLQVLYFNRIILSHLRQKVHMVQEHKGQGAVVSGCRSHTLRLNNNMVQVATHYLGARTTRLCTQFTGLTILSRH